MKKALLAIILCSVMFIAGCNCGSESSYNPEDGYESQAQCMFPGVPPFGHGHGHGHGNGHGHGHGHNK